MRGSGRRRLATAFSPYGIAVLSTQWEINLETWSTAHSFCSHPRWGWMRSPGKRQQVHSAVCKIVIKVKKMLTYYLHSTCRLLGMEDRLTPQTGVCGRKALFCLCWSFGQVPGCQESVMLSLASSLALFHSSHIQDKAQINIGILYKNLVQLIKAQVAQ